MNTDTIVAIASAPGKGAIGIIRASGAAVPSVASTLLGRLPAPRSAVLSRFRAADGTALDQGLAIYFPAPASFTGEHVLELYAHGGMVVLDLLVQRLVELGCRRARPGEFSERAFLTGKIDLAQAEAVADLIEAGSAAAARAAIRSLQGEFSARVHALQSELTALRVHVEAAIDFPDEEIEFLADGAVGERVQRLFAEFDALGGAARQGAVLREGLTVVIAGRPNAGKSSLMNRLAGGEVAIVAELPGTTRDVLRERIEIDGMPLHVADTAGLRAAGDSIEAEGIRRAEREMQRADLIVYVVDASAAPGPATELAGLPAGIPVILVFNKIDLVGMAPAADAGAEPPRIHLCAKTGEGIDLLRAQLKQCAGYRDVDGGALAARGRHLDALRRARAHAEQAAQALRTARATELIAEELRLAQQALGEITGEFTSEDLLGKIFGSFCIGK